MNPESPQNNLRDSKGRIAGRSRHHGDDLQNLQRAVANRATDSTTGGVRSEFVAVLLVAWLEPVTLMGPRFERWCVHHPVFANRRIPGQRQIGRFWRDFWSLNFWIFVSADAQPFS